MKKQKAENVIFEIKNISFSIFFIFAMTGIRETTRVKRGSVRISQNFFNKPFLIYEQNQNVYLAKLKCWL